MMPTYPSMDLAHCSVTCLGVLTDATADLAVTLLLATARRISEAMRTVRVSEDQHLSSHRLGSIEW